MAYLDREGHRIYYETYGKRGGQPVIFLHGGPGVNISDHDKRFFHPDKHFAILFDQRGCGKSEPLATIKDNTTQHLIDDIQALLDHYHIQETILFGGSWGATLALSFGIRSPNRVQAMVLRGVFMADLESMYAFLGGGIAGRYPEAWGRLLAHVPHESLKQIPEYFYDQVFSGDPHIESQYAYEWLLYGASTIFEKYDPDKSKTFVESVDFVSKAKVQLHYLVNHFFLANDHIMRNAEKIADIPIRFLHGRHDHLCPLSQVEKLMTKLNQATLTIVEAGHAPTEPELETGMIKALLEVTELA